MGQWDWKYKYQGITRQQRHQSKTQLALIPNSNWLIFHIWCDGHYCHENGHHQIGRKKLHTQCPQITPRVVQGFTSLPKHPLIWQPVPKEFQEENNLRFHWLFVLFTFFRFSSNNLSLMSLEIGAAVLPFAAASLNTFSTYSTLSYCAHFHFTHRCKLNLPHTHTLYTVYKKGKFYFHLIWTDREDKT